MSTFTQAIYISFVGMGLVFVSLGLLLVVMLGLRRIFPDRPARTGRKVPTIETPEGAGEGIGVDTVAAISAALAHALSAEGDDSKQDSRCPNVGGWVMAGRSRQLNRLLSRKRGS